MYVTGAAPAGGLADYLRLTIELGTGGSLASCDGFVGRPVSSGTLGATFGAHRDFDTGVGEWLPTAGVPTRTYRVTYTLDPAAPTSVGGTVVGATFVWERRPAG